MRRSLTLQWHITNRCNKRCKHCYQEDFNNQEFSTKELIKIGEQYIELLKKYNSLHNKKCKGHINITGGEPFIRDDIFEILDFFYKNRDKFTFGILSNGSYLTEDIVNKLKKYKPTMVQISLDGNKKSHDYLRGKGSYDEVVKALKLLNKYNIKGIVSFTANNKNYKEFKDVVKTARKAKAHKVWSDRLVPMGSGDTDEIKTLNQKELKEYLYIMEKDKNRWINRFNKLEISMNRGLQFLSGSSCGYKCSAGDGLIIIMENGDIMPCRRLPLIAGNLKKDKLDDIYFNSDIFKKLRIKSVPEGCETCGFIDVCNGGSKCISYGVYNNYNVADPACPLQNNNI